MIFAVCASVILITSIFSTEAKRDCGEFWGKWRICPEDALSDIPTHSLLCFHELTNSQQVVITNEPNTQAGIVCHNSTFQRDIFHCLPLNNLTVLMFKNCPIPDVKLSNVYQSHVLQQLNIEYNKIHVQNLPLIINDYPSLQVINLYGIFTTNSFDLTLSLPNLIVMAIRRHNFTSISNRPFINVPQLQNLFITEGILEYLPDDFFYDAHNIVVLDLSVNRLKAIQTTLLDDLIQLKGLNLSHNNLKELVGNPFSLPHLQILALDHNHIHHLSDTVFRDAINLNFLFLHNNNITNLTEVTFKNLLKLQILTLNSNHIHTLPENIFSSLPLLIALDLSHNCIRLLPSKIFQSQTLLTEIDLSENQISSVSSRLFGPSKSLSHVNMSKNQFIHFPDVNWNEYNITQLDLSHNNIQDFVFPAGMVERSFIYLQYNQIKTVTTVKHLGPEPSFLYHIYLEGNPFSCDCSLVNFVESLPYIPISDAALLRCQTPWHRKGTKLQEIHNKATLCTEDSTCPQPCQCDKTDNNKVKVYCNDSLMSHLPYNFPSETVAVYLNNNNITDLSTEDDTLFQNVTHIYLSNNSLHSLNNWTVPRNLHLLTIDKNRLSDLPQSLMNHINATQNFRLYLADNAWSCNCKSVIFKKWFMQNLPKIQDSMVTYCKKDDQNDEPWLLVETRISEFVCSSAESVHARTAQKYFFWLSIILEPVNKLTVFILGLYVLLVIINIK